MVRSAWSLLPTAAICEMGAVTVFAFNLLTTFAREAPANGKAVLNCAIRVTSLDGDLQGRSDIR